MVAPPWDITRSGTARQAHVLAPRDIPTCTRRATESEMSESGAKHLHVELSVEARSGWRRFADQNDVTIAAAVEAVGLILPDGLPERLRTELLVIARQVTAERRSRRLPDG